jgi:hypothetical protein
VAAEHLRGVAGKAEPSRPRCQPTEARERPLIHGPDPHHHLPQQLRHPR